MSSKYGEGTEIIWKDRKRWLGMPLSFTRYRLVKKEGAWVKLITDIGLLFSAIEEVNLYRIIDISLRQSLIGKIVNTGVIIIKSNDETRPTMLLRNVKNPYQVRDMISTMVEEQRKLHNVQLSELNI